MKTLVKTSYLVFLLLISVCCIQPGNHVGSDWALVNEKGMSIQSRFKTPVGFERTPIKQASFADYLQNLPLKAPGSKVRYYDGSIKYKDVYEAVVDLDIESKNLQQCADAVIRLRAEYLYAQKLYDKISFNLTNGFRVDYSEWMKGNRVKVNGNQTYWQKSAVASNTYADFRNYLSFVFTYAGTLSLDRALYNKDLKNVLAGDVFIVGGSPGHAVIVVDVAENKKGEKVFLLAQSYMPAQEIQILKNPNDKQLSPWYEAKITDELITPEWTFKANQLKTWEKN